MKLPRIKSFEIMLSNIIHSNSKYSSTFKSIFNYVINHFKDEDYLYNTNHCSILDYIYIKNCYSHKQVLSLSQYFHLDNKTILTYRKNYLKLFAKKFLNLNYSSNLDFIVFYSELKDIYNHLYPKDKHL